MAHGNGVGNIRKIPRQGAGFREASVGYIAAIDFGTTYCSVAYTLQDCEEIFKLPLDGTAGTRVPNAILIKKEDNSVAGFGYFAQNKFSRLTKNEQKKYLYFERMKMILYRTPNVNRDMPVSPINSSEQYYLVDIVSFILKYLKDKLYEAVAKSGLDMSQFQFDWVVTVPAIWDVRGKQMMREAAYKAGLCSSLPNCELIPYSRDRVSNTPVEDAPDILSLALEPEAAGLWCQNPLGSGDHYVKPRHFTVLDIGGGTVDITSYHLDHQDRIRVVDKASGNDWGGTRVNEQFAKFLEDLVDDPGFKQYVSVSDAQLQQQHKADLNKLIYCNFEREKMSFDKDEDMTSPSVIHIPSSFIKFYKPGKLEAKINLQYKGVAELDGYDLNINPDKMRKFFQPAIDKICGAAVDALKRAEKEVGEVEAVYLVGGFGGSRIIKEVVQDTLQEKSGPQLEVFVPIDHIMAIACGAIIYRQNPEVIWARKAEATYGDEVCIPFDTDIHDPYYKKVDENGKDFCQSLFRPYVEIGDTICADEVLQNSVVPFDSKMTNMCFTVYSSNKRDIWYTRNKNRSLVPELKEIGELVFDLQGIPGSSKYDKRVVLTIDLSQTEIQLKAHHEETKREVKVVLDTLSQH